MYIEELQEHVGDVLGQFNCMSGADLNVNLFDKIRRQTFMNKGKDARVEKGTKIRLLVLFESDVDAFAAYYAIKGSLREKFPDDVRVYRSRIRDQPLYFESTTKSMLAQWLCNLELKEVEEAICTCDTVFESFCSNFLGKVYFYSHFFF